MNKFDFLFLNIVLISYIKDYKIYVNQFYNVLVHSVALNKSSKQ